jgi:putative DNA primase/helicase
MKNTMPAPHECNEHYQRLKPKVLAGLKLFVEPGETFEVRALRVPDEGGAHTATGFFDNLNKAAEKIAFADNWLFPNGFYLCLNQCTAGTTATLNYMDHYAPTGAMTGDADILWRRWMLVDIDPSRPSDCCANAMEKEAAMTVATEVIKYLTDQGWPAPIVVDSGNGIQAIYKIDLPATTDSRDLIKGVLTALDKQFSELSACARVDVSTFNASRISRLPGTWNRKGPNTLDRPHRVAELISAPEEPGTVSEDQLRAVAGDYEKSQPVALLASNNMPLAVNESTLDCCRAYLRTLPDTIRGQQASSTMLRAARHCAEFGLTEAQAEDMLAWFSQEKAPSDDQWTERQIRHKIDAGYLSVAKEGALGSKTKYDIVINAPEGPPPSPGGPPPATAVGQATPPAAGKKAAKKRHKLNPRRITDLGNVDRFLTRQANQAIYVPEWKAWVMWDGTRWSCKAPLGIWALVDDVVQSIYDEARDEAGTEERKALWEWAICSSSVHRICAMERLARGGRAKEAEVFDQKPWLLNVQNGTLNLATGALSPHSREDLLTTMCPVTYDPAAACPAWLAFLDKVMAGSKDKIAYLQTLVGYSLTGIVREHILPIMWGSGSNGKSTFNKAILGMLGGELSMQAPPTILLSSKWERHPTDVSDLRGKRFVAVNETGEDKDLDEVLVKSLTGGDRVRARRMRQDFFEFTPTHKVWMATNHRPTIKGTDKGLWRRLALVGWEVEILEKEYDRAIDAKLAIEYSGILNWALEGCRKWQAEGLVQPLSVANYTKEYKTDMDVIGQFIDERCILGVGVGCVASVLYQAYKFWAVANGFSVANGTRFGRNLTERKFAVRRTRDNRVRLGIVPRNDILWQMDGTGEWQQELFNKGLD